MENEFDDRMKAIELELTALKTASIYTSVRSSYTAYSGKIRTGIYRITFNNTGEGILSYFFTDKGYETSGGIYPRTPIGPTQIVEVNTTYDSAETGGSPTPVTYELSFVVVSNVPVTSITRIS